MSTKSKTLVLVYLFSLGILHCQHKKLELANEKYELMAYMDAARLYESVFRKGVENEEILRNLGNSYFFNANYGQAEKWYSKLFEKNKAQDRQTVQRYLQVLKIMGRYQRLQEYSDGNENGIDVLKRINNLYESPEYFFNFDTERIKIEVEDAGINSENSDYGTSFFGKDLIFTSSRALANIGKNVSEWTNEPFSNLFKAQPEIGGGFKKPKEFLKETNTKFNESTAVFTKDGETMFFTRNDPVARNRQKGSQHIVNLRIYRATRVEGQWGDFLELPFNGDDYNCAHPALSSDERILYFVSNMPGTMGQSDLFKVGIHEDGTFGTPENLGALVNTMGRETFPYISSKGELFFSSDGHFGIGGLDILVAIPNDNDEYEEVLNLGDPINSPKDDFGFYINERTTTGFFSSNREGGHGNDDIYRFTVTPEAEGTENVPLAKITKTTMMRGVVTDGINGERLSNVAITVHGLDTDKILARAMTNENGEYTIALTDSSRLRVTFQRRTHKRIQKQMDPNNGAMPHSAIRLDMVMQPVLDAKVLADLNKIYFNSNDSYIREDAALELDKLVVLMLETYPDMIIRRESHTDPVGTHEYNDWLSQRRATSTYTYLVSKGVPENRIASYTGFGKRKAVNDCGETKKCTSKELELNRRTEFPIIRLKKGKD